jgi:FixJ family two-component response regulator
MSGAAPSKTIVVVENDLAVLNALTFSFETEGYDVMGFEDAESLLAVPRLPGGPTCLVLDYKLPGLSGLALLAELRVREVSAPAILITTNPPAALHKAARRAGVEIVEKPLLGRLLADRVREAVTRTV